MSASLFDFGLYFFRNHGRNGRYLYLPKLESHLEARLWNDVFIWSQERLGVPQGTIKATVLIETILAAFEMDEILYELRDHSAGLNAGRWDYIFSVIKKLGHRPEMVLPDRGAVTMAVPFMRSYCELLVQDLPPPRRLCDGRHGGVHPLAARPGGERSRPREGARGQGARGGAGLRRHLGRPPRPRPDRDRGVRRRARRPAEPDRPPTGRRHRHRSRPPRHRGHTGRGDRGRPPQQRLGRDPVPRRLAPGLRRSRDQQPDGGRGDRRDQPLPDLAVAPPRPLRRGRRPPHHRRGDERSSAPATTRPASSSRSIATRPDYVEFLTLPAYDRLVAEEAA